MYADYSQYAENLRTCSNVDALVERPTIKKVVETESKIIWASHNHFESGLHFLCAAEKSRSSSSSNVDSAEDDDQVLPNSRRGFSKSMTG